MPITSTPIVIPMYSNGGSIDSNSLTAFLIGGYVVFLTTAIISFIVCWFKYKDGGFKDVLNKASFNFAFTASLGAAVFLTAMILFFKLVDFIKELL